MKDGGLNGAAALAEAVAEIEWFSRYSPRDNFPYFAVDSCIPAKGTRLIPGKPFCVRDTTQSFFPAVHVTG